MSVTDGRTCTMSFQASQRSQGQNIGSIYSRILDLPQWFRVVTGFVQLVGAAVLIIGYWFSGAVAWAGIWLGITTLLAFLAHIRVKDPIGKTVTPVVFLVLIIILVIINAEDMLHPFSQERIISFVLDDWIEPTKEFPGTFIGV